MAVLDAASERTSLFLYLTVGACQTRSLRGGDNARSPVKAEHYARDGCSRPLLLGAAILRPSDGAHDWTIRVLLNECIDNTGNPTTSNGK